MQRLPREIHLEIFSRLSSKDRYTCLSVSRAWNTAAKTCVYEVVRIKRDENLAAAIAYFKNNVNLANQVMDVRIADCENIYQLLPEVQQLFPNMSAISSSLCDSVTPYDSKTFQLNDSWKKLEVIETDESFYENAPPVLELILKGYCPKLTDIYAVFFLGDATDVTIQNHCLRIINLLKNAPLLTTLDFEKLQCPIDALGILHRNAPNLDKLVLGKHPHLTLSNSTTWSDPIELAHLSHLEISFFELLLTTRGADDVILALFDYIGKKYAGLSYFSVTVNSDYSDNRDLHLVSHFMEHAVTEERLLPLFARCPGLVYYDQMFTPLSDDVTHEMDRCGIQLQELGIHADIESMEDQIIALISSEQRHSVKKMALHNLDNIDSGAATAWPTELFAQLTNLKELWLDAFHHPLSLSQLPDFLKHVPHLEKLDMQGVRVISEYSDSDDIPTSALKSLSVSNLHIDSMRDLRVANTILKKVFPLCPDLEKISFGVTIKKECKPEDDTPFTTVLDCRGQEELTHVWCGEDRYYVEGRWSSKYYRKEDRQLVETTEPFASDEHYVTLLLSGPVLLDRTKIVY